MNMRKLLDIFNDEYNFLYENNDNVVGYEEAVSAFDNEIEMHRDVLKEFCEHRKDFISSDREAAAFMFALQRI